jgi:hypothetical protein
MQMKTLTLAAAFVLLASCTTQTRTDLVISGVVAGTGTPPACVLPLTGETDFITLGPDTTGHIGLVVENRLGSTIANSKLELDQHDFMPTSAAVSFELISAGTGTVPAPTERPAGGYVKTGATASVGVVLFDSGQIAGLGLTNNAFFRANIYLKGGLSGGGSARTSEREYLFKYCNTAGCAGNACL